MELDHPTREPKRAFHAKVRTGCLTCKARRVKCDEAKPHCQRCVKSGRKCDGYRSTIRSSPPASALSPAGLFETASERRSFYYFQTHACHSLGGPFNSSFWARGVLLAAVHYRPIRHLLALQQCNQSIRQLAALSQPGAHPSGIQSAETVYNMLTASLLFVYFACVRGRIPEAIQHVLYAVKILHEADR
ncbi:hypothetical protein N656DRAFT_715579, partial [Canariomyces notabilis]